MSCRDLIENYLGVGGIEYISDTVVHRPPKNMVFTAILPTADATITAITGENISGNSLASAVLPKGVPIYGRFSSISLASGTAIAYKGV